MQKTINDLQVAISRLQRENYDNMKKVGALEMKIATKDIELTSIKKTLQDQTSDLVYYRSIIANSVDAMKYKGMEQQYEQFKANEARYGNEILKLKSEIGKLRKLPWIKRIFS